MKATGGLLSRDAIVPLLVGALAGFIGGYFAAGAARPTPPVEADTAAAPADTDRVEELSRSLERDPENPQLLTALGNAYYDREDWDRAVNSYEKARREGPGDPNLLSDLGAAYRNRGQLRQAISFFERAREKDPQHWQSLLNLVLVHAFDRRDPAAAEPLFDDLRRRFPEIPRLDEIEDQISRLRGEAKG